MDLSELRIALLEIAPGTPENIRTAGILADTIEQILAEKQRPYLVGMKLVHAAMIVISEGEEKEDISDFADFMDDSSEMLRKLVEKIETRTEAALAVRQELDKGTDI